MGSAEAARTACMKVVRKSVTSILSPAAGCESVAAAAAEAAGRRVHHFLVPFTTALHDGVSM